MERFYILDLSSTPNCPIVIVNGQICSSNNENVYLIQSYNPIVSKFSESNIIDFSDSFTVDKTTELSITFYSIFEAKFYSTSLNLYEHVNNVWKYETIEYNRVQLGMLPNGIVTLWLISEDRKELIYNVQAKESDAEKAFFRKYGISSIEYTTNFKNVVALGKSENNDENLVSYKRYIKKYCFRYIIRDVNKGKIQEENDNVEKSLFVSLCTYAGDTDKTNETFGLYINRGVPLKTSVRFIEKKCKYQLFLFFNESIIDLFEKYYGAHPETKSDIMICYDIKERDVNVSFYRYGLKETFDIPESSYQFIVFKSGFEYIRSKNYNQSHGSWVW